MYSTPMRPLLFVPGLISQALIVGGFVSENYVMVGVGFSLAGVVLVVLIVLKARDWAAEAAERKRIWTSGKPATARVVNLAKTPRGGEDDPEVDLDLEVRVDGTPPSAVKVRTLISQLAVPRVQPGCEIQVRVDPADGKKLVIDPALTPYRMD